MFNSLACRRTWIAFSSLLLVVACSDDEGSVSSADSVSDGFSIDTQLVQDTTVEPDLAVVDVSEFPGHGEPCSGPGDCDSGWCVESPDGQVCTSTCNAGCPDGWECREVISASGDPIYICISLLARLCHPCGEDADCSEAGAAGNNRCISYAPEGSFCGIECIGIDNECPEGYQCDPSHDIPQCVPSSGECSCNGLAVKLSLSTSCSQSNDIGECVGARVCQADGLTDCNAGVPSVEDCNGLDDDCDGLTDEELDGEVCQLETEGVGICEGILSCANGVKTCVGAQPAEEICNGIDDNCDGQVDEGFEDMDLDGTADCVDKDTDGDNFSDIEDCGPGDPTVYPGAQEICDGKDNDCNNLIDDEGAIGCTNYYADVDKDTYGAANVIPRCLCEPDQDTFYTVLNADDCNDLSPIAYPGAAEECNAQDDDCDGEIDEVADLPSCPIENGFGICIGQMTCLKGVLVCDGQTPLPEECNGVDDDCNGVADDGMDDTDGDLIADCVDEDDDNDGTKDVLDCQPLNPQIHMDAQETCNGIDENCNGIDDDEDAVGCTWYYQDADQDGYGADKVDKRCFCSPQPLIYYTALDGGDCDDITGNANPLGVEVCNGLDDDCDGTVDEGVASPCGGCNSTCVMEVGGGKPMTFAPDANNSQNVSLTPSGALILSGGNSGYYRHVFEGWQDASTYWDFLAAYVQLPGSQDPGNAKTSVKVEFRVGSSKQEMFLKPFSPMSKTIPPDTFPVPFNQTEDFLEVKLTLSTIDPNSVPLVDSITVVAKKAP